MHRLSSFQLHFGRFVRDALGVLLIAAGVLVLLASFDMAGGSLLTPLTEFLSVWLGWGVFALVGALGASGAILIRPPAGRIAWGKIFCFEVAALAGTGFAFNSRRQFARPSGCWPRWRAPWLGDRIRVHKLRWDQPVAARCLLPL